jgi:hypothetical protein
LPGVSFKLQPPLTFLHRLTLRLMSKLEIQNFSGVDNILISAHHWRFL